ncbi:MAG: 3-isopropylmalate dehydratase large subunit [Chromatiales bacterium]|jgi:3-isopropylmalate/(R)-2-methylmalate dehydratase large subunit|nr:3-isopropylmalate dehydratase large subunit [Chromatiales bacterium]
MPSTLIDKLWDAHTVADLGDGTTLLYIDRVFLHERTGSVALQELAAAGRAVRNPEQVFCTMDHIVDTLPGRGDQTRMPGGTEFITATRHAARAAGINLFDLGDPRQGIVHVVSPEQGIALPGVTLVCPDSHTCTLGGLGALAWGIGSTEGEHALATKTLVVRKPKLMRVWFDGHVAPGVYAKDLVLHLIQHYGASGGSGYAVEFAGPAISALGVEARLTLCNMAVEFGAFTGIIAPDEATIDYVRGRTYAPKGADWDRAVAHWRTLKTDADAVFDREIRVDASALGPQVTWGTSPQHGSAVDGQVPNPAAEADANRRQAMERALAYMGLAPGTPLAGLPINAAFIGSCTNSRLSDLREAARVLRGRRVAPGVKAICVPGSTPVKLAAEAEGLDQVFRDAGFEWRESGCSMCFFAGGESFGHEERVVTSTNRNFENRQGPRTRSHLASPATVAASAIAGRISDPRPLLRD